MRAARLPAAEATLVVRVSSDAEYRGKNLSSITGNAVTPDHLWPAPVSVGSQ
ncbi:hypothetical protein [Streptomyces sp. NPDC002044]|uniref:hypothetical protein n=1 Tax=Streptomyces sp. NPDC002044 TaxID=3154662 RepID=UPI0033230A38